MRPYRKKTVSCKVFVCRQGVLDDALLGLGLDLLLDGTLSHGFVVRGGSFSWIKSTRRLFRLQVFSHPRVFPRINFSVWGRNMVLAHFASPPQTIGLYDLRPSFGRLVALHIRTLCSR